MKQAQTQMAFNFAEEAEQASSPQAAVSHLHPVPADPTGLASRVAPTIGNPDTPGPAATTALHTDTPVHAARVAAPAGLPATAAPDPPTGLAPTAASMTNGPAGPATPIADPWASIREEVRERFVREARKFGLGIRIKFLKIHPPLTTHLQPADYQSLPVITRLQPPADIPAPSTTSLRPLPGGTAQAPEPRKNVSKQPLLPVQETALTQQESPASKIAPAKPAAPAQIPSAPEAAPKVAKAKEPAKEADRGRLATEHSAQPATLRMLTLWGEEVEVPIIPKDRNGNPAENASMQKELAGKPEPPSPFTQLLAQFPEYAEEDRTRPQQGQVQLPVGKPDLQLDASQDQDQEPPIENHTAGIQRASILEPEEEQVEKPELTREPQLIDEPKFTDAPQIIHQPELIDEPELIDAPEIVKEPQFTDEHQFIDQPELTDQPELIDEHQFIDAPQIIHQPEIIDQPDIVKEPQFTDERQFIDEHQIIHQPERTEEPKITDVPELIEQPQIIDEPQFIDQPELTDQPERTEEPKFTDEPELFDQPEIIDGSQIINTPELIDAPEIVKEPQITDERQFIEQPQIIDEPHFTDAPELIDQPEIIDGSQIINTPELIDQPDIVKEPQFIDQPKFTDAPELIDDQEFIDESDSTEDLENPDEPDTYPANDEKLVGAVVWPAIQLAEPEQRPAADPSAEKARSKRGRKSLKDVAAEADLIEIPTDEVLFSKQYYTMGEVAEMFHVNQSLLRFWETEFSVLQPKKNKKGDRHFRPVDIKNLHLIYHLLRQRKYTIEGAKEFLKKNKKADQRFEAIQRLQQIRAFLLELKAQL